MANNLTVKQEAFCHAYLQFANATEAYRQAYNAGGMKLRSITKEADRMMAMPAIAARIAELRAPALKASRLSVERMLTQLRCVTEVDPRRFWAADGTMKPPHEWDDDMAAAVASVEANPVSLPGGKIGFHYKLKFWDKNAGLDKAMRHLGLFEKDNAQSRESLTLKVVAAKPIKARE